MKWFDRWFYKKSREAWESRDRFDAEKQFINEVRSKKMGTGQAVMGLQKGLPEGEDRINFELSSAVGGKILNVRKYDPRNDNHHTQTYVIPTGEDIGERVAKIINLEMFR